MVRLKKQEYLCKYYLLIASIIFFSCDTYAKTKDRKLESDTICFNILGRVKHNTIVIDQDVNLCGAVCMLREGLELYFKGGIVKNGTLIGNKTKIKSNGAIFDKILIKGSWLVPQISTTMFVNLNYDNALKNVLALSNPKIKNVITVEKGNYQVKALKNMDTCLTLNDNTELILNGNINIVPNVFPRYDIIKVQGCNITIRGNGTIIGDKHIHKGKTGEWGMGVRFHEAINSSIQGITIKDCWGDCIYIGGNSRNVLINNCFLDHGRRQGVSITKAKNVTIRSCKIANVYGTNPQYAIDIEPNTNDTVDNVIIEKVKVMNCKGGILATKRLNSAKTRIGNIVIRYCSMLVLSHKIPIHLQRCQSVLVERCIVNGSNARAAINVDDVQKVVIKNNTINITRDVLSSVKNAAKKLTRNEAYSPICVGNETYKDVQGNIIYEK